MILKYTMNFIGYATGRHNCMQAHSQLFGLPAPKSDWSGAQSPWWGARGAKPPGKFLENIASTMHREQYRKLVSVKFIAVLEQMFDEF